MNPYPTNSISLSNEHLSLADVRSWLDIPSDYVDADNDAQLNILIPFAREAAADFTWRGILEQSWAFGLDAFPSLQKDSGIIRLPKSPCISVDSIQYVNSEGTQTLVEGTDYRVVLEQEPCVIEPINSWPSVLEQTNAVIISFTAGYKKTPGADVRLKLPDPIKIGMLQLIKFVFDSGRESAVVSEGRSVDVKDIPWATKMLWGAYSMREFV